MSAAQYDAVLIGKRQMLHWHEGGDANAVHLSHGLEGFNPSLVGVKVQFQAACLIPSEIGNYDNSPVLWHGIQLQQHALLILLKPHI